MSGLRYPNESREYRNARDSLLRDEQELIDKVKSVAEKRHNLPPGGQLKEDYVFQWAKGSPSYLQTKTPCCFSHYVRSELGQSLSFLYLAGRWV